MNYQASIGAGSENWVRCADITLDDEFRDLVPLPNPEARQTMKEALLKDGCAEALIVWPWNGQLRLLIGYQVYPTLLQAQGLKCRVQRQDLPHRGLARQFIINHYLTYKFITHLAMSYYRGLRCRQGQLPPGGDRKSEAFRLSLGKRLSAEALGELYGLKRKCILHEADFAAALDKLATVANKLTKDRDQLPTNEGHRIKPLIFGHSPYRTMGCVIELAERSEEEQLRKLKELLFTGKLPPCDRKGDPAKKITLPRVPIPLLIAKLYQQLNLEEAVEAYQEFGRRLQEQLAEKGQKLPEIARVNRNR